MQEVLDAFAQKVATFKDYTVKTAERGVTAKYLLEHSMETSAAALLMALRNLYGIDCLYWEPETLWLTVEKDGIELPEEARNKIQAAITLIHNPSFFWDNIAFQWTTQALNNQVFDPEALQECHPAHMAWAVYEATLIRGLDPDDPEAAELDEDVQQYIAVCLKRAGFVYPPDQLRPVSDNLAGLLPADQATFIEQIKKTWEHLDKKSLPEKEFQETPLDVQLSLLASVYEYIKGRAKEMAAEIVSLEKGLTP